MSIGSLFLTRAELSRNESAVNVTCIFADEFPEASCVLVYREYNKTNLTVKEYSEFIEFPVTIFIDDYANYTFALFGKNGADGIDAEPVITIKGQHRITYVNVSPAYGKYLNQE